MASDWKIEEKRFWAKVDKNGPTHPVHGQCWVWVASTNPKGYGTCGWKGKTELAHRVMAIRHGLIADIRDPRCVLHHCDNPGCVNPAHLWLGTRDDNMADMKAKGRRKGKGCGFAKNLSREQIVKIQHLYTVEKVPVTALAARYGLSRTQVYRALNYEVCVNQILTQKVV
jgi:AraC-like DNA-binding protein